MKYKKNKLDVTRIVLLNIIILIILVLLNKFDFNKTEIYKSIKKLRNNIETIFSIPFKKPINKLFSKDYDFLYDENLNLKNELLSYKIKENKEEILNNEINDLKKILELNKLYSTFEIINSKVIIRKSESFYDHLIIDKGSKNGIENGNAVVTSLGLIGKIIDVSENSSTVKLICSNTIEKISVMVDSDKLYQGVLATTDHNNISVLGLTNYDNVKIGDKVKTSGLGNFPRGIQVGTVSDIKEDNYKMSKIIYLNQDQDLTDITYVAVLKG